MNELESQISLTISGQATIHSEFRIEQRIGPIGLSESPGQNESFEELELANLILTETGELMISGKSLLGTLSTIDTTSSVPAGRDEWRRSLNPEISGPSIDLTPLVQVDTNRISSLSLEGNFSLSFWDGSFTVDGTEYWAGERHQFEAEGVAIGESTSQIIHMEITDGSIEANFIETPVSTYWSQASVTGNGDLSFQNARSLTGELLGDIETQGEWSFDVTRGDALEIKNLEAEALTVDGAIIQDTTTWYWWLTAIPFVLLAAYFVRPPAGTLVKRMERDLEAGRYLQVAGYKLKRILRSKNAGRATLYRATALLAMQQYQEAGLFLQSITKQERPDPATYHLLYANALAGIGSKDEAARELAACIALVPSYATEASNIPLLAPLLGRAYTMQPDYV